MSSFWFSSNNAENSSEMDVSESGEDLSPASSAKRRLTEVVASLLPAATAVAPPPPPVYAHSDSKGRQQFLVYHAQRLRNESDISFILEDPQEFARLQKELRRSGAVTNAILQHGIYFYAREHHGGRR